MPKATLITIGYQGLNIQTYIELLKTQDVGIVLDVREIAWSRKKNFSKSQLKDALLGVGIEYLHIPSAGNPSAIRRSAKDSEECLQRYREYLAVSNSCLDELMPQIILAHKAGRPACLTCFEALPEECHRSVLIDFLQQKNRLQVIHLSTSYLPSPEEQVTCSSWVP